MLLADVIPLAVQTLQETDLREATSRKTDRSSQRKMILTLLVVISTIVTLVLLLLPSARDASDQKCSVQVVVLGDLGRSPRMQYHALSIVTNGGHVQLIGYRGKCP